MSQEYILERVLNIMTVTDLGFDAVIYDLERQVISWALSKSLHNKSQAAELLGLKRTTFVMRMKKHGMKLNEPFRKIEE
jgi:DNA-binding protein Fis